LIRRIPLLLLEQGFYQVEGLFMKNWDEDDRHDYWHRDGRSGGLRRRWATKLGISAYANFAAESWDNVFEHFS